MLQEHSDPGDEDDGSMKLMIANFKEWIKARRAWAQPPVHRECTVPPSDWLCTRNAGHEGPCAAYPLKYGER